MGKVHGRIGIEHVREVIDGMIEEQNSFHTGCVCVNQVLVLRQVAEKAHEWKVYTTFLDLEKTYGHIDRKGL